MRWGEEIKIGAARQHGADHKNLVAGVFLTRWLAPKALALGSAAGILFVLYQVVATHLAYAILALVVALTGLAGMGLYRWVRPTFLPNPALRWTTAGLVLLAAGSTAMIWLR